MQAEDTGEAMQRKRPRNVVDDDGGVGPAKQVYPLTCSYAHPSLLSIASLASLPPLPPCLPASLASLPLFIHQ